MKYPKITITGDLGSGKSTVAKYLSEKIKFHKYSTGDIQRNIATKYNMTTLQLNEYMKSHPEIDDEIDNFTKKLNLEKGSFILDSRMGWYFIPKSFKIFLKVKSKIAANRIYNDQIRVNEKYKDIDEALRDILNRKQIENERFKNLYNVNCIDMNNYDIVIDTSYTSPNVTVQTLQHQFYQWLKRERINKYWISPKLLYPTQDVKSLGRNDAITIYDSVKNNGFDENFSVDVLTFKDEFYIFDGHKRTSAAIINDIEIIPIRILAEDNAKILGVPVSDFIQFEIKPSFIYSWESCHKFLFEDLFE